MSNRHCTESQLYAYRREGLAPEERAQVAAHLATCRRCADALAAEPVTEELATVFAAVHAPDDLVTRVLTRLDTEAPEPVKPMPWRVLAFTLAGAAAIALALWLTRGIPLSFTPGPHEVIRPPNHALPPQAPHRVPVTPGTSPTPPAITPGTAPSAPGTGTSIPAPGAPPTTERHPGTPTVTPTTPTTTPGTAAPPDPIIVRGPNPTGTEIRGAVPGAGGITVAIDPKGPAQLVQDLLAAARADVALGHNMNEGGIALMPFRVTKPLPADLGKAINEAITDGLADGDAAIASRRKVLDALTAAGAPDGGAPNNAQARAAATSVDAALYLLGEVTDAGTQVRIHLTCYETATGKEVAHVERVVDKVKPAN